MAKAKILMLAAILATFTQQVSAREGDFGHHMEHRHFAKSDMIKKQTHKRQNFNETSTRTLANGEIIRRDTVQKVTDNGFTRHHTMTNNKGQIATKNLSVSHDKKTGTHTRSMTGTTFEGKNFSRTSTTQKNDKGFTRKESFVTPDGKTGRKDMIAEINKQAGTISKTTTFYTPEGEVKQNTVTHKFHPQKYLN